MPEEEFDEYNKTKVDIKKVMEDMQRERRTRICWTLGIIFVGILFLLIVTIAGNLFLEKFFPNLPMENRSGILIVLAVLVLVPLILLREAIIENFSKYYREEKKIFKLKIEQHRLRKEEENKQLRERLVLPHGAKTLYEEDLEKRNEFSPRRILGAILLEILCLFMTLGIVIYSLFLSPEWCVAILCLGIAVGIYGGCVMCGAYVKGILYILRIRI